MSSSAPQQGGFDRYDAWVAAADNSRHNASNSPIVRLPWAILSKIVMDRELQGSNVSLVCKQLLDVLRDNATRARISGSHASALDLVPLTSYYNLRSIIITGCHVEDMTALGSLGSSLHSLSLVHCSSLVNLSPLTELGLLVQFRMHMAYYVQ